MPYVFSAGYASLYHCGYVRYGGLPAGGRRCGIRTGREAGEAYKYADQFPEREKKNLQSGESGFSESLPGTG